MIKPGTICYLRAPHGLAGSFCTVLGRYPCDELCYLIDLPGYAAYPYHLTPINDPDTGVDERTWLPELMAT